MSTSEKIFDDFIRPLAERNKQAALGPLEIRNWRRSDADELRPMIRAFLEAGFEQGGELVADDHNVEILLEMGMKLSEEGWAILVATKPTTNGGEREIIAWVTWAELVNPFHLKERTVTAYGTYTKPEHRSAGLAHELRTRCAAICIARGVHRVVGPIHSKNVRGVEVFEKDWNARVLTHIMEGYV